MDCLYHYCANEKLYGILEGKNIRMGDIGKSNDSLELQLFFPYLHHAIFDKYIANPFPFRVGEIQNEEAMREMVHASERLWDKRFDNGDFSNFVVCFSEISDSLSQWRGYADDGKGGCIGFSKKILEDYCEASNGVLRLEKVIYADEKAIEKKIESYAESILEDMSRVRELFVSEFTHDDNSLETDRYVCLYFDTRIGSAFSDSLRYKTLPFHEEQEWRIFLSDEVYKRPDWIFSPKILKDDPNLFRNTMNFLNKRMEFRYTNDDLIPFCPLYFADFPQNPVTEVWLGPKNNARQSDVELFLRKFEYPKVDVHYSNITYR